MGLRPLVPLRLDDLGAEPGTIGVVVASQAVVALVLALPSGRFVDLAGAETSLVAALAVMAATGVGYAVSDTVGQLLILQLFNGLAEMLAWLALQTLISQAGTGAVLQQRLALFSLMWGIGAAAGPLLGLAVYEQYGVAPMALAYAGLALGSLVALLRPPPLAATASVQVEQRLTARAALRRIAARPAVRGVLASTFVALFLNSVKVSFYPLLLQDQGLPVSQIGVLLAVMGVASVAVRLPLPRLQRRFSAAQLLVWGMWVSLLPMAITPWLTSFILLFLAAAAMGLGHGVNPPITVQLMAEHTAPGERGLGMGLRVTSNRLAQVTQPVLFGGVASLWGLPAAFAIAGVTLAGLTVWAGSEVRRMTVGKRPAP